MWLVLHTANSLFSSTQKQCNHLKNRDKTNPFVAIGWNVLRNTVNIPPPNRISRAGTPVMKYSGYVCWDNSWTCSSVLSSNERKIIYWLVPTVKGEYS